MRRLLALLILASVLVIHDVGPSAHAHAAPGVPVETSPSAGHEGHSADENRHEEDASSEIVLETCGTERLGSGWNRSGDLEGKPGAVASLPLSPDAAAFDAICPSLLDHPPGHPPDRLHALFNVYRI